MFKLSNTKTDETITAGSEARILAAFDSMPTNDWKIENLSLTKEEIKEVNDLNGFEMLAPEISTDVIRFEGHHVIDENNEVIAILTSELLEIIKEEKANGYTMQRQYLTDDVW